MKKHVNMIPGEYFVDLDRSNYRGSDAYKLRNIRETHGAFSKEQALGFVLKKYDLRFLYEHLISELDDIVTENKEPKPKPRQYEQGELFEICDDDPRFFS